MRVKVNKVWYQLERLLSNGIKNTDGKVIEDSELYAKLEELLTEAEFNRRFKSENPQN